MCAEEKAYASDPKFNLEPCFNASTCKTIISSVVYFLCYIQYKTAPITRYTYIFQEVKDDQADNKKYHFVSGKKILLNRSVEHLAQANCTVIPPHFLW